jgi:hypothetical protein
MKRGLRFRILRVIREKQQTLWENQGSSLGNSLGITIKLSSRVLMDKIYI